jgi:ABC-2 type transport system permease protein
LPKPINDRTILMAKLLHIVVHLNRVVLPMSLPVVIFMGIDRGLWAAISLFILILLASLFAIFLVNAIYLLVLKLMSPEKFKSFIAWFQIGFVIFLYGGYQIFLRLTNRSDFREMSLVDNIPARFFPPYWFARAWEFANGDFGYTAALWLLLSLMTSIGSIWIVVRYLAPSFNRKLSMIQGSGSNDLPVAAVAGAKPPAEAKSSLSGWLADLFTRSAVSRAAFLFTWRWTNRNRGFRMRVFPTIGYLAVWVVVMLLGKTGGGGSGTAELMQSSYNFLLLLYFSSFITISAIQQVSKTDEFKAAWIFYSYPVEKPGAIILGGFSSILCKFFLPLALILSVTGIVWKGMGIIPNLVFGLSNQLAICAIILLMNKKAFPASQAAEMNERSGNFMRSLFLLMITGTIGLLHFLVYKFTGVIIILTVLSGIANWLLLKKIGDIGWNEVREYN